MFSRISVNTVNWILITGALLLVAEILFFNTGLVFSLLFLGFLTYMGWKNFSHAVGKIFFFIGIISVFFTVVNMMAVRFVVVAAIILFAINYRRSSREPEYIKPKTSDMVAVSNTVEVREEPLIRKEPLFRNRFFGRQETDEVPYRWQDVNIHSGFGDKIIDLSNTVLPDHPVISVRHFIGNIKIYVPYEVEVSLHHSSVFGRAAVFQKKHDSLVNQTLLYETENYGRETGNPELKIVTSVFSGDIEVKRI